MDCLFCKIAKGELPSYKIYEDEHTFAFLDISPVSPGHVLIIPKRHYDNLDQVDDLLLAYMMRSVKLIGAGLKKALGVKGYNVIINNGEEAGQIISHFHLHLIPRRSGDGLKGWPQQEIKEEDAKKIVKQIKAVL